MSDQGNGWDDSSGDGYWQYNDSDDLYQPQIPPDPSVGQTRPVSPTFVPASPQPQMPAPSAQPVTTQPAGQQAGNTRQRKKNNTVLWIIGAVVLGVALGVAVGFIIPHFLLSGDTATESTTSSTSQTPTTQPTDQPTDEQTTVREDQPDEPTGGVTTSERPASGPTEIAGPANSVVPKYEWLSAKGTVAADKGLNVRNGPGVDYAVVSAIGNKESFTITAYNDCSKSSRWYYITYNGTKGWVSADYVTVVTAFEGC